MIARSITGGSIHRVSHDATHALCGRQLFGRLIYSASGEANCKDCLAAERDADDALKGIRAAIAGLDMAVDALPDGRAKKALRYARRAVEVAAEAVVKDAG